MISSVSQTINQVEKPSTTALSSMITIEQIPIKLFAKRWLILFIFSLVTFMNAVHVVQYNIIQDIVVFYYTPSLPEDTVEKNGAVNWMAMIFMLDYIVFVFPVMYLLEKKGLKLCVVLGALTTCVGAWIKCGAVHPKRFAIALFGQAITGIGQVFVMGIPPKLSSLWFGSNEVSTATAIGVFSNQLGIAIGTIIPPLIVPNTENIDLITTRFYYLMFPIAGVCTLVLILSILSKQILLTL